MADTVELPGMGRVDRKYLYGAIALVAGIVGYAWWNRSRSEAAPVVDPLTGSQDPATGGAYVNPRPVNSTIDQTADVIDTNAEWTQAVTERLSIMFYDSTFIATTIGKYLARQPLTTDEADLIRTAWAYEGKPPDGPDSFTLTNTGGNAGTQPYVLYWRSGQLLWALAGGPEKWQETTSQTKANEWAAAHMLGKVAITIPTQALWDDYKAKAQK